MEGLTRMYVFLFPNSIKNFASKFLQRASEVDGRLSEGKSNFLNEKKQRLYDDFGKEGKYFLYKLQI